MSSIVLKDERVTEDFWELNPHLLMYPEFEAIKKKWKKDSSKIMWAIYLVYDYYSPHATLLMEKRLELANLRMNIPKNCFKTDEVKAAGTLYEELQINCPRKAVDTLQKKVEERLKFLEETPYDIDIMDKLDKIVLSTPALLDALEKMRSHAQELEGKVKGGQQITLNEKGKLS